MFRPLTDYESFTSKSAKEKANFTIKAQRKELTKKITDIRKAKDTRLYGKLRDLEWQRNSLGAIKGMPIRISLDGQTVVLNYMLLKQIEKQIPSNWTKSFKIEDEYGKPKLVINFQKIFTSSKGTYELFELPDYQVKLLGEVPIIYLAEEEVRV